MAADLEIRERQKAHLHTLLQLQKMNSDIKIKGIARFINEAKTRMNQEDIAFVEKMIEELEIDF